MDQHKAPRPHRLNSEPTRRAALIGAALTGLGTLAGCLGGGSETGESMPDPITIESDMQCDNCTMTIGDYPGPAGQSFYADADAVLDSGSAGGEGDDQDRPAQFCSSRCTYNFTFEHEAEQEPEVRYLTDYSAVDYEIDTGGDKPEISRHLDADGFAPVADLTFVVDSEVQGAMGASLIGFSDDDDADSFQAEYGGDRYEHDEVNRELIQSLMN